MSQKGGGRGMLNGSTKDEPLVAGSAPGEDENYTEEEYVPCILRYITLISRLFGLVTLTALWAFTVLTLNDLDKYNAYAPWYLLTIALLATFFESIWLLNKCITCRVGLKEDKYDDSISMSYSEIDITRRDDCCCRCWRLMIWMDNWRKACLYVAFGVPMFIRNLVTVYTVICGLLLLILAALYFLKSFKESKCVARKPRSSSYVQTSSSPKPNYVPHPVQTQTGEYAPASHGYDSLGHTNSVQPSEHRAPRDQPAAQDPGTNYFRPFKPGVGNVQEDSDEPVRQQPNSQVPEGKRKSQRTNSPEQRQNSDRSPTIESQKAKLVDPNGNTSKDKSSPPETRDKPSKPKSSSGDEGSFKLFGLLKKDDKPKEAVVPMFSSERSAEEDIEHYPEDKNPFESDDCEWDPNNRGGH